MFALSDSGRIRRRSREMSGVSSRRRPLQPNTTEQKCGGAANPVVPCRADSSRSWEFGFDPSGILYVSCSTDVGA